MFALFLSDEGDPVGRVGLADAGFVAPRGHAPGSSVLAASVDLEAAALDAPVADILDVVAFVPRVVQGERVVATTPREGAEGEILSELPTRSRGEEVGVGGVAGRQSVPLGLRAVFRDDVDQPVESVGAPEDAARPSNDLDAIDVLHVEVLETPPHAREEGGVDDDAVDHHQDLVEVGEVGVREAGAEAADGRVPVSARPVRDEQSRHHAQGLLDRVMARPSNLVSTEDVDGGGR